MKFTEHSVVSTKGEAGKGRVTKNGMDKQGGSMCSSMQKGIGTVSYNETDVNKL